MTAYARPLAGFAAATAVAALAGCAAASSSAPRATATTATAVAAAAPTTFAPAPTPAPPDPAAGTEDCPSLVAAWKDSGAADQIAAITADLQSVQGGAVALAGDLGSGADPTADEAVLQSALASLQGDAGALQGNLPPACIPHMSADLSAALAYYTAAAATGQQAVTEISDGNYSGGAAELNSATDEMARGTGKISAATADADAFSGGQ